jgi:hypothetical protein
MHMVKLTFLGSFLGSHCRLNRVGEPTNHWQLSIAEVVYVATVVYYFAC